MSASAETAAKPPDSTEYASHLRLVHFTLTLACVALLLARYATQPGDAELAFKDAKTFLAVQDRLGRDPRWLQQLVEKTTKAAQPRLPDRVGQEMVRFEVTPSGRSDIVFRGSLDLPVWVLDGTGAIDLGPASERKPFITRPWPRLWLKRRISGLQSAVADEHGAIWLWPITVTQPTTIGALKDVWNGLYGKTVLVPQYRTETRVGVRIRKARSGQHPDPDPVTNDREGILRFLEPRRPGQFVHPDQFYFYMPFSDELNFSSDDIDREYRTKISFREAGAGAEDGTDLRLRWRWSQPSLQPDEANYRAAGQKQALREGEEYLDAMEARIPTTRIRVRVQEALIEAVGARWVPGRFEEMAPKLNKLSKGLGGLSPVDLANHLKELGEQDERIEIATVKLPVAAVQLWGPLLLIAIEVYLLVHLHRFRTLAMPGDAAWRYPWVALYPGLLPRGIFVLTAAVLPLAAAPAPFGVRPFRIDAGAGPLDWLMWSTLVLLSLGTCLLYISLLRKQRSQLHDAPAHPTSPRAAAN